jgi:uncharacterized protein (TIGR02145 family)
MKQTLLKKLTLFIILLLVSIPNAYTQTITIGEQVWTSENLNVSKFRNGDPIPYAKSDEEWKKAAENRQPAWCYFDNESGSGKKYGKLYNWYAVNDTRGIAPAGYHIPTDTEWTTLIMYLGGENIAGTKLKSKILWAKKGSKGKAKNKKNLNKSGFSGLPGGKRYLDGEFFGQPSWFESCGDCALGSYLKIGDPEIGCWWSSSIKKNNEAWSFTMYYEKSTVEKYGYEMGSGFSVRCIKD